MGTKIRVLIVDDSFLARSLIVDILDADPAIEIVGIAEDATKALAAIGPRRPDVVLLDALVPGMSGIEGVRRLRTTWPSVPVLLMVPDTERGAELEARASVRAIETLMKPGAFFADSPEFVTELRARIKELAARGPRAIRPSTPFAVVRPPPEALAIASGAGGPQSLARLFGVLPHDLALPIFVVQHMPGTFTRMLADRLRASTGFPIHEAIDGERALPGSAYLAPGDFHLQVDVIDGVTRMALDQGPSENGCRPAANVLFRSLARTVGPGAIAVLLRGLGRDGVQGATMLRAAGGRILTEEASGEGLAAEVLALACPVPLRADAPRRRTTLRRSA